LLAPPKGSATSKQKIKRSLKIKALGVHTIPDDVLAFGGPYHQPSSPSPWTVSLRTVGGLTGRGFPTKDRADAYIAELVTRGISRTRGRPARRLVLFVVGEQHQTWTVIAVADRQVTFRCLCGLEFERYASTATSQIENSRRPQSCRVRPLYCGKQCGLIKASGYLASLRSTAKKRGIPVSLTLTDMLYLRVGRACVYCRGSLPTTGGGLDRMDPSRGYHVGNVAPCCYACNTAKGAMFTHAEFLAAMQVRVRRVGPGNAWKDPKLRPGAWHTPRNRWKDRPR
jgi:hypothetical protein